MMGAGFFKSIPKLIALFGVLPLLLLLLWLTWFVTAKSMHVQGHWPQVLAQVVEVNGDTVTLQVAWQGSIIRGDVKRENAFANLAPLETITLYANPANPAELSPTGFGDLWAGTITLGVVCLFLLVVLFAMLRIRTQTPGEFRDEMRRAMEASITGGTAFSAEAPHVPHAGDDSPIELREPRQSWRANVFWGLMLGVPAIAIGLIAGPQAGAFEKYITLAIGIAWLSFMGFSAYRNFGRTVRCDHEFITVSQAFGSKRIALAEVKSITREDVRQQMRDFDNIGVSRMQQSRTLDTKAPMIMYVLRDGAGKQLLRLDKDMEPPGEMARFLRRLENLAGPIASP
jgi:hypothetical protein